MHADLGLGSGHAVDPHQRPDATATSTRTCGRRDRPSDAAAKAAVLTEALPYIQRWQDQVVVIKYGGNALAGARSRAPWPSFASDVALMRSVGMRPVVVHGGGPQIGALLARLGKATEFVDGLRVTDAETLDVVRMVLLGQVNPDLVAAINVHGPLAVGLSGADSRLLTTSATDPALGFVGDVAGVNPDGAPAAPRAAADPGGGHHRRRPVRPGAQRQRRHRRRRHRRGAGGGEADLPHRHRRPAPRRRRPRRRWSRRSPPPSWRR